MARRANPATEIRALADYPSAGKYGFQGGNPSTGLRATQVSDSWLNMVQEEIVNVVEKEGVPLNASDNAQMWSTIKAMVSKYGALSFVKTDGTGLVGVLLAKAGAIVPNNTANAGYAFASDPDTGMFSGSDGTLQFASNGVPIMQTTTGGAVRFSKAVLAPKGMPASSDGSYLSGFAFDGDNDTGVFARGGTFNTNSDVVIVNDSIAVASARSADKAFVVETRLVAVDASGVQRSSTHSAGSASVTGDLPVNAEADVFTYDFVARGPYATANFSAYVKMSAASALDVTAFVKMVRLSDGAVLDASASVYGVMANSNTIESASPIAQSVTSAQLVGGQAYRVLIRAYKSVAAGPCVIKNLRIDLINS